MATPIQGPNVVTSGTPGTAVIGIAVNQSGGYITNPTTAEDQGVSDAESLYVDPVTNANLFAGETTTELLPGETYYIIPNSTKPVTVSSQSPNHNFTAVQWL
jgi:hypothetical protein